MLHRLVDQCGAAMIEAPEYAVVSYAPLKIMSTYHSVITAMRVATRQYHSHPCGVMRVLHDEMGYALGVIELTSAEQREIVSATDEIVEIID